mgnify:CR=1 FL=1
MYNYIKSQYKKYSSNRKFVIFYYLVTLLLYLTFIILGIFNFDKLFRSMFILLGTLIFFINVVIFIYLGYKIKDWKLFFKFKQNKKILKQKLKDKDNNIIKRVLFDLKIKRRNDIKVIIEHYRLLSISTKKKYNYVNFISTIIAIFVSFKDIFVKNNQQLIWCFAFLFFILFLFSILYFSFIQIIDLKDIISGNKNIYRNLEELLTKEYIDRK